MGDGEIDFPFHELFPKQVIDAFDEFEMNTRVLFAVFQKNFRQDHTSAVIGDPEPQDAGLCLRSVCHFL